MARVVSTIVLSFGSLTHRQVDAISSQYRFFAFVTREFGETGMRAASAAYCLSLLIIGVGLWRMLPWARTAEIVVSLLTLCSFALRILEYRLDPRSQKAVDLTDVLFAGLVFFYLCRSKIRGQFLGQPSAIT